MSHLVGLDLSLASSGVACFFRGSDLYALSVKTNPKDLEIDRLGQLVTSVRPFLKGAELVVIESQIVVYHRGRSSSQIAKVHGAIDVLLYTMNLNVCYVAPIQLKAFVGSGYAKPTSAIMPDNDALDASVLVMMGHFLFNSSPLLNSAQRDILGRLSIVHSSSDHDQTPSRRVYHVKKRSLK